MKISIKTLTVSIYPKITYLNDQLILKPQKLTRKRQTRSELKYSKTLRTDST